MTPTDLTTKWNKLLQQFKQDFGIDKADLNGILFLIGVQELGKGPLMFSRGQKEDLLHIATCRVLSIDGYFRLEGHDHDGWPKWQPTSKQLDLNERDKEQLIKQLIIKYFSDIYNL